ncbi:phosphoribosylformylglycinamidine synthase I, partial [Pelagibacteraceae bacterium]|nr:phosphoribosylformylglycinamidine synthase I [Pelagibacteraceae bacterium]
GFSYGDYLRSGAIAAKSKILEQVIKAGNDGCLILGICNGFQILIETGLLQGTLLRNKNLKFLSKDIFVKVMKNKNRFCNKYKDGQVIKLNIAHNEGNYFTNPDHMKYLEDKELIAFKYCNEKGETTEDSNPNGSQNSVAGIFNDNKNILGMMPHPERMISKFITSEDGVNLFSSLLK